MWEVIVERDYRGNLRYCVENSETGDVHGTHDCRRWAEAIAAYLNEQEERINESVSR